MMRTSRVLPVTAGLLMVACATVPTGPSVMVLPGSGKNFEQFQTDDAVCRQWAAQQTGTTTKKVLKRTRVVTREMIKTMKEKEAVEFRMLVAELDHRNYVRTSDPASGLEKAEFKYPADVTGAAQAFNQGVSLARQLNELPHKCRSALSSSKTLTSNSAPLTRLSPALSVTTCIPSRTETCKPVVL